MTDFMDRHFRYLKAGQKEYTEAEVRAIIDGAIQEEREACAVMINILQKSGIGEEHLVEAIRARGKHDR